jgi:hypothetical protein
MKKTYRLPTIEEHEARRAMMPPDIVDFIAGDNSATPVDLATRLYLCLFHDRPIPLSLRADLIIALSAVGSGRATWDDVFGGFAPKKGKHRNRDQHKRKIAHALCCRVEERRGSEKVDKGFFDSIGREFGVSGTGGDIVAVALILIHEAIAQAPKEDMDERLADIRTGFEKAIAAGLKDAAR